MMFDKNMSHVSPYCKVKKMWWTRKYIAVQK